MDLELRRRAYLAGLAVGIPTLPIIWIVRGTAHVVLDVAYPALALYLVTMFVGLWSRRIGVRAAERATVVAVAAFEVVRITATLHGPEDLADATRLLTEASFWNIVVVFVVAYLAHETARALRMCLGIYAVVVLVVASRLVPELAAGAAVSESITYLRVLAFHAALIGLLYGLAQVKEALAEERVRSGELAQLAHTDPLTGLPNRRALQEELDRRLADAQRYQRPLSLLMLDLDWFKSINDRYGHPAGDTVLRQATTVLRAELRANDVLARWGGEEFVVLAPETDEAAARQLAERCRTALEQHEFPLVDDAVTASIGVAAVRPSDQARDVVKRADDALYRAKRAGRNRVELVV